LVPSPGACWRSGSRDQRTPPGRLVRRAQASGSVEVIKRVPGVSLSVDVRRMGARRPVWRCGPSLV
jgi:hypothetical protein